MECSRFTPQSILNANCIKYPGLYELYEEVWVKKKLHQEAESQTIKMSLQGFATEPKIFYISQPSHYKEDGSSKCHLLHLK